MHTFLLTSSQPAGLAKTRPVVRRRRRAFSMLELLVTATLLLGLISVVVPLSVRAGRIWQEARSYRLAANELSNQLEDLTMLSDPEREQALGSWKPSDELLNALPDVRLTGETIDDANGKRLKLSLVWRRAVDAPPLTMVGWIQPERQ